ncbi:unnamed protein product [Clonostachys rhizophaga]|uniref:Zn(2)-C6 fungal-type domain-containing protein n=1 Tax=Clonostachys rhizophaga TaxID=160324 RepID=A0A9N9VFS1_9HYPO|nr:unnamed protein product [Clonostachys rhizophaga]
MESPVPESIRVESLKQGFYQCSHCQRTFNRADHLQRHVRSRNLPGPVPSSLSIVLINARFVTKDFVGSKCMFLDSLCVPIVRGGFSTLVLTTAYRDLLKRHAACHKPDEQGVKRRRQLNSSPRVAQACRACAAAKLKCDKDKVCNRCLRKGIACEREPRNGSSIAAKSPVADPGFGRLFFFGF